MMPAPRWGAVRQLPGPKGLGLLLPMISLVAACRAPEPIQPMPVVVREYVVVPAPEPQIPPRPVLPSSGLPPSPSLHELIRALLADRERLAAWALDLEARLKAYLSEGEPSHD